MSIKYKVNHDLFERFWEEYTLPMAAVHYNMPEWIFKVRVPYAASCSDIICIEDDQDSEWYFEIAFKEEKDLTYFLLTL